MFYSHEVLTSRKYGVATVWLVATLGAKSTLKKVSRKAILDVDVQKACETIVTPEAPMALRLQSNLLYGVTRVYAQQCGYVLTDAEAARSSMRTILNVMRTSSLDAECGNKGRADQLILQDDPNFLPDLQPMLMDIDNLEIDMTIAADSQRSTLSPHNSQVTNSSQQIGGLIIPGESASSMVGGPVGGFRGFGSVRGDSVTRLRDDPDGGLIDLDDLGITMLPDGSMHMSEAPVRQSKGMSSVGNKTRVSRSSPGALLGQEGGQLDENILERVDDGFMPTYDDFIVGADDRYPAAPDIEERRPHSTTTIKTADAPLRRRAAPKIIPVDNATELRNGDLARWNTDYVANMQEVLRHRQASRLAALAKQNAEHWILGSGLGPLGFSDQGPLSMFSGAKLLEALTGSRTSATSRKRSHEDEPGTNTDRRVRSRSAPSQDEVGRGVEVQDDGYMPMMDDDTIEQGRDAPTPLDDRQLSGLFPWNQSTGSRRPTGVFTSASMGGVGVMPFPSLGSRRGSRLVSASPLMGRGTATGLADTDALQGLDFQANDLAMTGLEADEFELFGSAANVDTQTAAQSQWQRSALDGESVNFLAFVQAGVERADQIRTEAAPGDEEDDALIGTVDFETLLPTASNSCVVAAQALLHVLALGTSSMLQVDQDEPFGAISLRVISA